MKKIWMMIVVMTIACLAQAELIKGTVGLPTEHIAIPLVAGQATIKVWDVDAQAWVFTQQSTQPTKFEFAVPAWEKWYWVGVWDHTAGKYVVGQWISHQRTD